MYEKGFEISYLVYLCEHKYLYLSLYSANTSSTGYRSGDVNLLGLGCSSCCVFALPSHYISSALVMQMQPHKRSHITASVLIQFINVTLPLATGGELAQLVRAWGM